MIFIWNGVEIEAIDLDKAIPGPRAKEIARHLEPGYLRGYLEGRRVAVGFQEIRSKGKVGKGYRQIRSLMTMTHYDVPTEAPWRYAMYLKEKMLEQATATTGEDAQLTAPHAETSVALPVDGAQPPQSTTQPTMPSADEADPCEVPLPEAQDDEAHPREAPLTEARDDEAPLPEPRDDEVPLPEARDDEVPLPEARDAGGGEKRRR